ncbi:MAG: alkaline phosphatase family protein [Terracidiphilus sp.]
MSAAGIGALLLPLVLTGCSEYDVFGADATPAVTIAAKPASIAAGASSSLTVTAANAAQVTVTGSDGKMYNLKSSGGTLTVGPSATTTYTAVAAGAKGSASAKATVTVTDTGRPTVTITADPLSIVAGSTSMLTVKAVNATQVTISGSNGAHFTLKPGGGEQKIDPKSTTTYTAVATGSGGTASAKVTVDVTSSDAPGVTIIADPSSIASGGSSTLTVVGRNATEVTVTGTNGRKFVLPGVGGKATVHPASTTTFMAVATGPEGKATAKAIVAVKTIEVPTVSIKALPVEITAGSSSILTVSASDANQITVTGTNGKKYGLPKTGGKIAVSPVATTLYTAVATAVDGKKASASLTIKVTPNPAPTVTIAADPPSITSGSSSTLVVDAAHATKVTITSPDGTTYTLEPSGGRQLVSPTETTKYTATATGPGGTASDSATVTVTPNPAPSVTITANPTTIVSGNSSSLKVTAANATQVTVTGTDHSSYSLAADGGTQSVSPTQTTSYTAVATGPGGKASESVTVTVTPPGSLQSIDHVIFMLQENHTFDDYFGMLNPYRSAMGWNKGDDGVEYDVDGIDKNWQQISNPTDAGTAIPLFKFKSTCIDDDSSDWLASAGDVYRWSFSTARPIDMNGFVHTAAGYANYCVTDNTCSGQFTDTTGQRAMGYYDEGFLNYYYYMASQFALSDRWFSPVASKSIDNRIATFTGGTTQGLTRDPGNDDHLPQLDIANIFQELDNAGVSWKIYYTVTQGFCLDEDECPAGESNYYPATDFSSLSYSIRYLYKKSSESETCTPPTQSSSIVNDPTDSFCIDLDHIAPLSYFFNDLANGTLPSFAFIEAGYGRNDEHPGSAQSILLGQAQVANILDNFMTSTEWKDSVFFLSYDEGGGPYDHVPPVPGHSNDFTDPALSAITPDIGPIAVNPDSYYPCLPGGSSPYCNCPPGDTSPTTHCDLLSDYPGATAGDAAYEQGFGAQLGFRLPNMVISPFTKPHYVSHIPMDHTAIIKFVENLFIGSAAHLTARDAAQPNLLDFFDFNNIPWAAPPTPPAPYMDPQGGPSSCTPQDMGP